MTPLEKYIELKLEIDHLQSQLKEVETLAIEEALDQIYNQEGTGQTFAFAGRQVQVRFKARRPRPQDHPESEYLFEEIERRKEVLRQKNKAEIEHHQELVQFHQQEAESYQVDNEIENLKEELNKFLSERTVKQPELVIKGGK